MNTDSNGNAFTEIKMDSDFIRLTYIQKGWDGSPSIRIQMRDENGHLRQGPEIPLDYYGQMFSGTIELLRAIK